MKKMDKELNAFYTNTGFISRYIWPILRPVFFFFPPETAHNLVMKYARWHPANFPCINNILVARRTHRWQKQGLDLSAQIGSVTWLNPIGLAAGLDKNAVAMRFFASLGFGAVEVGTVTPEAQPGNDLPRLFRIKEQEALLNRMGFNNQGAIQMQRQILKSMGVAQDDNTRPSRWFSLGINIGKNKKTPLEEAANDYAKSAKLLLEQADYFVINVSSPNTPGLRGLQEGKQLAEIMAKLTKDNIIQRKPFFLKLAPDLSLAGIREAVEMAKHYHLQGVILSNTTIRREGILLPDHALYQEAGGISGKPLKEHNLQIVREIHQAEPDFPIIAVGGISSFADVKDYLAAGASACQVYSGLIYQGPFLIQRILDDLVFDMRQRKINNFMQYVAEIK